MGARCLALLLLHGTLLLPQLPLAGVATRCYTFNVTLHSVTRLCNTRVIPTVNGMFPGPKIVTKEGDRVVVKVINNIKDNITIHRRGVRQMRTGWSDGPGVRDAVPDPDGADLRVQLHHRRAEGHPCSGTHTSPGCDPHHTPQSSSYPGPASPCPFPSRTRTCASHHLRCDVLHFVGLVATKSTYFLRLITCLVLESTTVVQESGLTRTPRRSSRRRSRPAGGLRRLQRASRPVVQLLKQRHVQAEGAARGDVPAPADQRCAQRHAHRRGRGRLLRQAIRHGRGPHHAGADYQRAAPSQADGRGHAPHDDAPIRHGAPRHLRQHHRRRRPRVRAAGPHQEPPVLPPVAAGAQRHGLRLQLLSSLACPDYPSNVPHRVDKPFFAVGLGTTPCPGNQTCQGPSNTTKFTASMNNVSFDMPTTALLQAHYTGQSAGVYTAVPLEPFNYTGTPPNNANVSNGTKVVVPPYNASVEVVLQDTSILGAESLPLHLHGFVFFVVGQGTGNYDPSKHPAEFNLVDPVQRSTVDVQAGGWVAITFFADNPGFWFMHCHLEVHTSWGLKMAWVVNDGPFLEQKLMPPPSDLPMC